MLESIYHAGDVPATGFLLGHMHRYRFFYLAPDEGGGEGQEVPLPSIPWRRGAMRGCVSGHGFCFLKLIPSLIILQIFPGLAGRFIK